MIEFYLILSAVKSDLGRGILFRLFLGTVFMLASGYAGEAKLSFRRPRSAMPDARAASCALR